MTTAPRLFDGFIFFNELDLLELRLHELKDTVHRFLLVESDTTFTGQPKPLHYETNKARFAAFADRIIHIVVRDMPGAEATAWDRESHQRRAIMRGMTESLPTDAILISDVDEIPRAVTLQKILKTNRWRSAVTVLQSALFVYSLNLAAKNGGPAGNSWGQTPRLIERRHLTDTQTIRRLRVRHKKNNWLARLQERIEVWRKLGKPLRIDRAASGSWHFTYIGNAQAQLQKLSAFSHTELATADNLDPAAIERNLENRTVVFNKDIALALQPLDDTMPVYLRTHAEKFKDLLAE